ncbi:MAG: hypothetical protein WC839_01640 [Candidatus Paceibacterota bacterium]
MTNYIKLKNEALKDPKVKKAYDSLEFKFSNIRKSLNNKLKIKEKKI